MPRSVFAIDVDLMEISMFYLLFSDDKIVGMKTMDLNFTARTSQQEMS